MDSEEVKKTVMRQALQATNTANARTLIEVRSHSATQRS
jgi:import inner membrane translocase subunit TIM13